MKKLTFFLAVCALMLNQAAQAQDKKLKLEDLKWLSGCWKDGKDARKESFEQWTKPVGNAMLGIGATLSKDNKISSYEYMRIEAKDNGDLVFTAKPSDKNETSFTLTSSEEKSLVFENPQHDFPQRVIYRRKADGSLEVRVDGMVGEQKRAALFDMVKTPCD